MLLTCTRKSRGRSAFTLVEAVLVVAAIAILLIIVVPNFQEATKRSRVTRVKSDLRSFATAIESYVVDYDQPPVAPANYAGDKAPGVFRRVTNSLETFTPLTTPLSYVPDFSACRDLFRDSAGGYHVSIDAKRPGAKSSGYLFINFLTGVNAINSGKWCGQPMTLDAFYPGFGNSIAIKTSPVALCFNGDTTNKYMATWALISDGPSREDDATRSDGKRIFPWEIWIGPDAGSQAWEFYTMSAGASTYDPSNGTLSRGHIWRLSSGPVPLE